MKSIASESFLNVAAQTVFCGDLGRQFQASIPATGSHLCLKQHVVSRIRQI